MREYRHIIEERRRFNIEIEERLRLLENAFTETMERMTIVLNNARSLNNEVEYYMAEKNNRSFLDMLYGMTIGEIRKYLKKLNVLND